KNQIRLAGRIDSLAFSPGGNRAIVALDASRLMLLDVSDQDAAPGETLAMPLDRPPWATDVSIKETRVAFLDDETILVARRLEFETPDRSIPGDDHRRTILQAIDAGTGAARGGYEANEFVMLSVDPLPIGSRYVLLGRYSKTLALIDVQTWEEVGRL